MSTLATDNFTDTDDVSLPTHNANWATFVPAELNPMKIRSNGASYSGGSGVVWNGITWPNNQWAQATIGVVLNQFNGLLLRADPTNAARNCYIAGQLPGFVAHNRHCIGRLAAGAWQGTVWVHASQVVQAGDVIYVEIQGTTLKYFCNGVELTPGGGVTDSNLASGDVGMYAQDSGTPNLVAWDTFTAGDFDAGGGGAEQFVKVEIRAAP